jgi:hypothetical protein
MTHPWANRLEVFVPSGDPASLRVEVRGLEPVESLAWFGGTLFYAHANGGPWSFKIADVP